MRRSKRPRTTINLESLPQELLIKILCGVRFTDLKHLCLVSKTIRDAALVAKEVHFELTPIGPEGGGTLPPPGKVKCPDAPRKMTREVIASVSVELFR